jgi:hypothetical protein
LLFYLQQGAVQKLLFLEVLLWPQTPLSLFWRLCIVNGVCFLPIKVTNFF